MQRHRNIHTKEKVFQCNHCSKVLFSFRKNPENLLEFLWNYDIILRSVFSHVIFHFSDPIFELDFSSHTSLRRHEQKHQGINYKCSRCSRAFNDPSNLRRHEQSCNGEAGLSEDEIVPEKVQVQPKEEVKPHRCGYCSKVIFGNFLNIFVWFQCDVIVIWEILQLFLWRNKCMKIFEKISFNFDIRKITWKNPKLLHNYDVINYSS